MTNCGNEKPPAAAHLVVLRWRVLDDLHGGRKRSVRILILLLLTPAVHPRGRLREEVPILADDSLQDTETVHQNHFLITPIYYKTSFSCRLYPSIQVFSFTLLNYCRRKTVLQWYFFDIQLKYNFQQLEASPLRWCHPAAWGQAAPGQCSSSSPLVLLPALSVNQSTSSLLKHSQQNTACLSLTWHQKTHHLLTHTHTHTKWSSCWQNLRNKTVVCSRMQEMLNTCNGIADFHLHKTELRQMFHGRLRNHRYVWNVSEASQSSILLLLLFAGRFPQWDRVRISVGSVCCLTGLLLLAVGQLLDGAALAEAADRTGQPFSQSVSWAFGTRGAGLQRAEGRLRLQVRHRLGLSVRAANRIVFWKKQEGFSR